ncbi:GNAT family N-acetyltransferase [Ancylobacter amanitiformis]|uniref:Acetyltransferase n=1 Tax=Ancylobacter amanitiformis TaxID=217069 RepID=A0ABU0LKT4_9HYPH|nr:GNAT family N-acetyltransferase [Ancylobacter amanitiformis]MDQ0509317.1 putative acetyltransferase [Ancylobacter amanitiformis]
MRIEEARPADAEAMLMAHRAAVRGTAAAFYDVEIINTWAPLPLRAETIELLARRIERGVEEAVVARDRSGAIIGFGSIVPNVHELRAVYVSPAHGRSGIGGSILRELEARARRRGLAELTMNASINAEAFYRRHGFTSEGYGEHRLDGGYRMARVRMRLAQPKLPNAGKVSSIQ